APRAAAGHDEARVADREHPRRLLPGEADRDGDVQGRRVLSGRGDPGGGAAAEGGGEREAAGLLHRVEEGRERDGGTLARELLGPACGPAGPDRPQLESVAGRLSSPRFRRRLIRVSLLGAAVGAGALVSVLFWNTSTLVETPLHGTADLYVSPIPVKMSAAERRRVIATAARFVDTAVRRDHAELAFALVGPNLRNGTTKANWREGDIPVVPYPVDDARWKFDYSY